MCNAGAKHLAFGLLIIVLICAGVSCEPQTEGGRNLQQLLHGNSSIRITKFAIRYYQKGTPSNIVITNSMDLRYLSNAFRHSITNNAGSFDYFTGTIWFSTGQHVGVELGLADLSCMIVNDIRWTFNDPVVYAVPLVSPIPAKLKDDLKAILKADTDQ